MEHIKTIKKILSAESHDEFPDPVSVAEAVQNLVSIIERQHDALRPFARCVFNDNKDITVTNSHLEIDDYYAAYLADKQSEKYAELVYKKAEKESFPPYNTPVMVKTYGGHSFIARYQKNASMTSDETPCDQWQADSDVYPECWTDGCCWESNADEIASDHVIAWRAL